MLRHPRRCAPAPHTCLKLRVPGRNISSSPRSSALTNTLRLEIHRTPAWHVRPTLALLAVKKRLSSLCRGLSAEGELRVTGVSGRRHAGNASDVDGLRSLVDRRRTRCTSDGRKASRAPQMDISDHAVGRTKPRIRRLPELGNNLSSHPTGN